jgi:hypothetical protein
MRPKHVLLASVALLCIAGVGRPAMAFGGSARDLERQGTFVVTNNAGFGFDQQVNSPPSTSFSLRPALDYFIIPNLSIGGAIAFQSYSASHAPTTTSFTIAPEVGYEFALTDTWSFWPQAAISVSFPNPGNPNATLMITAPFLVHPAPHFFFGIGPGIEQGLTSNPPTAITGTFLIGGYFDH